MSNYIGPAFDFNGDGQIDSIEEAIDMQHYYNDVYVDPDKSLFDEYSDNDYDEDDDF